MKRGRPLRRTPIRTGSGRRGPALDDARALARARANGRCEANTPGCPTGPHRGEHAHHRVTRAQGGSDDVSNLLWICAAGHTWVHQHPAVSYEHGWLMHAWDVA